jgi:hypothetical protein
LSALKELKDKNGRKERGGAILGMIRPERLLIPDWLSSVNKNTIPPDHFAASPPANVKHCFSHGGPRSQAQRCLDGFLKCPSKHRALEKKRLPPP